MPLMAWWPLAGETEKGGGGVPRGRSRRMEGLGGERGNWKGSGGTGRGVEGFRGETGGVRGAGSGGVRGPGVGE